MIDSWEDWEDRDYDISALMIQTEAQLKQIEEKKLIEESEVQLAKDLIYNHKKEEIEDLVYEELKCSKKVNNFTKKTNNICKHINDNILKKKTNKQKENEENQKKLSKKIKEEKAKKLKYQEIFGEPENYNEYADYEDKFY